MNSAEIQYALDRRGVVDISPGSTIETPIQLAHLTGRIRINCPGDVTYAGPAGMWGFEWNWDSSYVHTPCHLIFNDLRFIRDSISHGGVLRINPGDKSPTSLTMKNPYVSVNRGHAIDANGVAYIDSVYITDAKIFGSGAVRWIGASADACGRFKIQNCRVYVGNVRLGATFLFKNLRNLIRTRIIDEGDPSLVEELKNVYYGPLTIYDINCSGYNYVDDVWQEPWGSWSTRAPGCWCHEIRADETSGNYAHYTTVMKNLIGLASNVDPGVALFHVTGGHTSSNAASLRADFVDFFNLWEERVEFAGKVFPVSERMMSNSSIAANDIAKFDDLNSDSFRDYWRTAFDKIPGKSTTDAVAYTGSDNETNFTAEPAQYDA